MERVRRFDLVEISERAAGAATGADDAHAERFGEAGDFAPDSASTDHADRFGLHGLGDVGPVLEVLGVGIGDCGIEGPGEVQHGRDRVLGDRGGLAEPA